VHVRRALLLFAIVLGLAALATSVSRPPTRDSDERERPRATPAPLAAPQESPDAPSETELRLPPPRGRRTVPLGLGEAVTLHVAVPEAGEVELEGLGLTAVAEPLTPARFDLLIEQPGVYVARFTAAGADTSRDLGRLVVR
jgi:hypothetical protein